MAQWGTGIVQAILEFAVSYFRLWLSRQWVIKGKAKSFFCNIIALFKRDVSPKASL
jgi:hypothetical protein